jgi:hypothetical protein
MTPGVEMQRERYGIEALAFPVLSCQPGRGRALTLEFVCVCCALLILGMVCPACVPQSIYAYASQMHFTVSLTVYAQLSCSTLHTIMV